MRAGSPTYGRWVGAELSAENCHQWFIPIGFAHDFMTMEANYEIRRSYRCRLIGGDPVALLLDEDIFFDAHNAEVLANAVARPSGATVFSYCIENPKR